jgi:hypothetical protein
VADGFTVAIVVLEREASALGQYVRQLERQVKKFPKDSKDHLGAQQALDATQLRIKALKAAVNALSTRH